MAYKIVYGRGKLGVNSHCNGKKYKRLRRISSIVFSVVCCLLLVFELNRSVSDVGSAAQIQDALSSLTNELEQGRSIGDAVSVFCEEILAGAGI